MNEPTEVMDALKDIAIDVLGINAPDFNDSERMSADIIDSLDLSEMVVAIEQRLHVQLDLDMFAGVESMSGVVKIVTEQVDSQKGIGRP